MVTKLAEVATLHHKGTKKSRVSQTARSLKKPKASKRGKECAHSHFTGRPSGGKATTLSVTRMYLGRRAGACGELERRDQRQ